MPAPAGVEKFELIYSTELENTYTVPKKQWIKWTRAQRQMFNMVFSCMTDDPKVMQHPNTRLPVEEWNTIAWNAAWTAADFLGKHKLGT